MIRASVLFAGLLVGCYNRYEPPPLPPPPPVEHPDGPDGRSACERACDRFEQLGCKEAEPSAQGKECADVCEGLAESGFDLIGDDPECIPQSQSCEEARECGR